MGGGVWLPWWIQAAAEKQLNVGVEDILAAARVRQLQESGRRSESEGVLEGGSIASKGLGQGREH